jgi:biotin transport system substrate-specific component
MYSQAVVASQSNHRQLLLQASQILLGSLLIALLAQIQVPLPFTPVPLTLQTLAVMLLAGILGRVRAALAVFAYLAEVGMGLPVLAGMASHPLALIGPRAGYLIGFFFLAYFAGSIFERKLKPVITCAALGGICLGQLLMGACWLGLFVGMQNALSMGFFPFLIGEVLKILAVCTLFNRTKNAR